MPSYREKIEKIDIRDIFDMTGSPEQFTDDFFTQRKFSETNEHECSMIVSDDLCIRRKQLKHF